jgi:flagellar motor switch protein FliN/FliY
MADETQPNTELPEIAPNAAEGLMEPDIQPVNFSPLSATERGTERNSLDLILDVQLGATVELGRSQMAIRDVLALGPGSVVELDKLAGEPADLLINGKPLARGEVVVIDENFGIRITEIMAPTERINSLR